MTRDFRVGLRDYLAAQVPSAASRLHPSVLPDKPVLPAVVYRVVSNVGEFAHDGPVELRNVRVQLDVWAQRIEQIAPIAREIETAMVGYRGPMGDIDYTAGWRLEDATDLYEDQSRLYRVSMDFRGWYAPQEET